MTDDRSADGAVAGRLLSRVAQRLPDGVKRRLARPYNRVQMTRADRAFRRREFESIRPAGDAPQHVVCVVVDALRADAITAQAPFLAAHRAGTALTTAPWTFPAVTSLVTGRYPHEHGSMRQSDAADRGATDLVVPPTLPGAERTLPEVFAAAGYRTYGAFAFHMPFFALGGRFERHALYDDAPADAVLRGFGDWIDRHERERTFSYLHLGDLHEPVDPPDAYWTRHDVDRSLDGITRWHYRETPDPGPEGVYYREQRRRLYRAAVDYVDDQLAALHDRLPDDCVLLVTADHGEALWEHTVFDAETFVDSRPAYGIDHGGTPYEAIVRVPLVADGLDLRLGDGPASLVDIAPTLLDALGHPDALATTGTSLRRGVPGDRVLLVEATRYGHERKAAYLDEWKLLVSRGDDAVVGFELPDETPSDLPEDVHRRLFDALPAWPDGEQPERRVSGVAQRRLEALGYV